MAVDSLRQEFISPTLVRVYFTSTLESPTFYVWVDGALFGTTTGAYMDIPVGLNRIAQVDVFDDANDAPAVVLPSTVILRWEDMTEAAIFRVEQWVDAAWVVRAQVPSANGRMPRWESEPLADGETHMFRVVPVDGTGRDGVPREFSGLMVRYPDAPVAAISVAGGEFTIADPA